MAERIDTPPALRGSDREQIHQIWDYLFRTAQTINRSLQAIGGNEMTDPERAVMRPILGEPIKDGVTDPVTLRKMIIQTAKYLQAAEDGGRETADGMRREIEQIGAEVSEMEAWAGVNYIRTQAEAISKCEAMESGRSMFVTIRDDFTTYMGASGRMAGIMSKPTSNQYIFTAVDWNGEKIRMARYVVSTNTWSLKTVDLTAVE